jgi:hypothetical protein
MKKIGFFNILLFFVMTVMLIFWSALSFGANRTLPSILLLLSADQNIQSYTFSGGTIDDLRAVSPTLEFGDLTISGNLWIPEAETHIILNVNNLYLNARIEVSHPTCKPFSSAPDLTVNASGDVRIGAVIDLGGHSGDRLAVPPEQTDCNDCYGEDGGSLTVNASNIYVNKGIDTSGGWAFDYVWGNTGHPYYQSIRIGCNGGDGGNITLNASTFLNISPEGADLDLEGG